MPASAASISRSISGEFCADAVERHLDADDVRVGGRLVQERLDGGKRIERMVHEVVLLADPRMQYEQVDFRSLLAKYREPSLRRSITQILTTLVPLFGLVDRSCIFLLDISYGLALLLAIPAAGLLMRVFIIQHDCGHGSYFKSKKVNDFLGMFCSILTMTPYNCWRKLHAVHHATSGDLDRRGHGDINTLTVDGIPAPEPR